MTANAETTILDLPLSVGPVKTDVFNMVANTTGSPIDRHVTVQTLFNNTSANLTILDSFSLSANDIQIRASNTPVTSGDTVSSRAIWFDDNYIYVAVSNTDIRRAA